MEQIKYSHPQECIWHKVQNTKRVFT